MLAVKINRTIVADLRASARDLADLSTPLKRLTPVVQRRVQAQFARSTNGWAALTPKYAARKARLAPGMPILILGGNLYRDYGREGVVNGNSYTYGNQFTYSVYHQDGTRYMVARPINYDFVEEEAANQVELFADEVLTSHNL